MTDHLRPIELFTARGEYVATVEIFEFPTDAMPKIVIWGSRFFVKMRSFTDMEKERWPYYEATHAASFTPPPGLPRSKSVPPPAPVLPPPVDRSERAVSGRAHELAEADTTLEPSGMQKEYVVLSDAERGKGFVRPVRRTYRHITCDTTTTMALDLAETYARDPGFYTATFCAHCRSHFPVGSAGEFVWDRTSEKVGT